MATQYKVVLSDCHLSAGRFFEGKPNPHEDFHFDDELVDLIAHFSTGQYGEAVDGPVSVELVLAGDILDFLNVPVQGEFEDIITEETALYKTDAILAGHPKVWDAFRRFASLPGKSITYLIGNHDADLFFASVREKITRAWDPKGRYPSPGVQLVADRDRLVFDGGVEVHHGNQLEASNSLDFEEPVIEGTLGTPILNLPWGSHYVLKILNRLRWERGFFDKIRPVKVFVLFGLVLDPWFTLRFCFLSLFYFMKTRLVWGPRRRGRFRVTLNILKHESKIFVDLESEARAMLDARPELRTVIMGHTHRPMNRVYPYGKQYINTGTWTQMINLDWAGLGRHIRRTFALVRISDGEARCELRHWVGQHGPHQVFE